MADAKVRVVAKAGAVRVDQQKLVMKSIDPDKEIKLGAQLDPELTELVQKMKEVAQATDHGYGHIRIMPKGALPAENCACGCCCS